tara:strand:+ start:571 stop:2304 length:1734 start_codon:yes stop_codon:yes gene_type:complete
MSEKKSLEEYISKIKNILQSGNFNEGLIEIQNALKDYPSNPKLHINAGNILKLKGNIKEAEKYYLQALSIYKSKEVLNNLSVIEIEKMNYLQAIEYDKEAIKIDKAYVDANYNIALAFEGIKDYEQCTIYINNTLRLDENNSKALILLFRVLQDTCEWKNIDQISKKLDAMLGNGIEHPFLNISRCDDEKTNFQVANSWKKNNISLHAIDDMIYADQTKNNKIKVGYICGEFRNHPTFHLMKNFFCEHNLEKFNIYLFSYNHTQESKEKLTKNITEFIDINNIDDNDIVKIILSYQLDILIDLSILIPNNKLHIMQHKLAKKTISYLGYPGTSGSDDYDYIVTDRTVTPEDQQQFYAEKFLYMPRYYQINDGKRKFDELKATKEECGLPKNSIILACFNQSYKIERTMFDCWLDILKDLPKSVLWILNDNQKNKINLLKYAQENGIEEERVIFAERVSRDEHIKRLGLADIMLDTRFYNGHTTTTDAIQCGIPVVTLCGKHFASRVTMSLLKALDLEELTAKNIDEYKNTVIKLAKDKKYKLKVKEKLTSGKLIDDFYNIKKFVQEFEGLLEYSIKN